MTQTIGWLVVLCGWEDSSCVTQRTMVAVVLMSIDSYRLHSKPGVVQRLRLVTDEALVLVWCHVVSDKSSPTTHQPIPLRTTHVDSVAAITTTTPTATATTTVATKTTTATDTVQQPNQNKRCVVTVCCMYEEFAPTLTILRMRWSHGMLQFVRAFVWQAT